MNDTNNTAPGVGGMTPPVVPQTPPMPEIPVSQPFSPVAPASPMAPSSAPVSVPSFGSSTTSAPATPSVPAWSPPTTPAPVPAAGSATWNAPTSSPVTPAWSAPSSSIPVNPPPPIPNSSTNDFKPEHEGKSKLPLIIAGILLILAMAGGYFLYMLYQTPTATQEAPVVEAPQPTPTAAPEPTMTEEEKAQQEIDALNNLSESDEVESLQQDVDNTDLSTVDSNLTPAAQ